MVVTDITLRICRLGSCQLGAGWIRVDKDLYLGTGWLGSAYIHVKKKKEEDLEHDDKVVIDVKVGRLDPSTAEKNEKESEKWETRPGGIWIKRSGGRHASDSRDVITGVDVLFGADALDPRPHWELTGQSILLDYSNKDGIEAKLSVRRGQPGKIEKPIPRVRKDGKFKIMQASDLHLSTGLGVCRDPQPPSNGRCDADPRTLEFVGRLLDDEKPDMVVLSGDQVNGETSRDSTSVRLNTLNDGPCANDRIGHFEASRPVSQQKNSLCCHNG